MSVRGISGHRPADPGCPLYPSKRKCLAWQRTYTTSYSLLRAGLQNLGGFSRLTQSGGIAWNRVNSAWFHIQGMNVMSKEYARIAYSIGKVLSKRRQEVANDPLPQGLAELLRRLEEGEKVEAGALIDAAAKRSRLVQS